MIALFFLLLDVYQLSSLILPAGDYSEDSDEIFGYAYLDDFLNDPILYNYIFYGCAATIAVWLLICNVLTHALWTNDYSFVNRIPAGLLRYIYI